MPEVGDAPGLAASRAESERMIHAAGRTVAQSGTLPVAPGLLSVHSAYGPPDQDKETNQDYVLAWAPADADHHDLRWAVAMADGVTASFAAEWGAELACWSALSTLVDGADRLSGMELGLTAVNAAGTAIRRLADEIEAAGDSYRPADEFPSTWEFILAEGLLLQTTLTLVWFQDRKLHLAMVGDGGAALREGRARQRRDRALVAGVPQTSRVHALGPKNNRISDLDVWQEHPLEGPALVALYTDGIRAGVADDVGGLLDRLESALVDSSSNGAQVMVEEFAGSGRKEFRDNLSLAVIRWAETAE